MKTIQIGEFFVGEDYPPFIIAEAGVNHESSEENAEKLVVLAKEAGAHAIKFQTYEAETLVARNAPKYWEDDHPEESQLEFFKRTSKWKRDKARFLNDICKKHGLMFLSTPFDIKSVDLLDELKVPAFKIASADITSLSFIKHIAKKGKPIILSTGASTVDEIAVAIRTIEQAGNDQIVLLHCILSYPTEIKDANLKMIRYLQETFPYPVGFSDHIAPTEENLIPLIVTALGGNMIEKHFTFDRSLPGNDHYHSVDGPQLADLVRQTNLAFYALGHKTKSVVEVELPARDQARRSIAINKDKAQDEVIEANDIILLRPGTGVSPIYEEMIVGMKLLKNIEKDNILTWEHVK